MKLYKILIMSTLVLGLTACGTVRKTSPKSVDVETAVVQYPTVADLNVQSKVEKRISWSWNPFKSENVSLAKSNLMADVLKEANADVLLEPQYTYTKVSFGQRTLTVTGFPATFKDFRKATAADLEALKIIYASPESKPSIYNVSKQSRKHKKFLGIF